MSLVVKHKNQPNKFDWNSGPRIFDDFFKGLLPSYFTRDIDQSLINPSMDLEETENEYKLSLELAGLKEKDVEVSLDDNILTVKGEKKFEEKKETKRHHVYERSYGSFERSLRLPGDVEDSKITASMKDGVLDISIPKRAGSLREHRKISVKSA